MLGMSVTRSRSKLNQKLQALKKYVTVSLYSSLLSVFWCAEVAAMLNSSKGTIRVEAKVTRAKTGGIAAGMLFSPDSNLKRHEGVLLPQPKTGVHVGKYLQIVSLNPRYID